jgi:hypothetical protein
MVFLNPVPTRDEWEVILPKFQGKQWEGPAEHLLYFHDFIHQIHIVHEDVHIKFFKYSLEGISCDWCRSLLVASIDSLTSFHAYFNSFCKEYFPIECLFEGCCNEFSLLHKYSTSHESQICDEAFIAEEQIHHEDHEVLNDIRYDRNDKETYDIISDVFVVLNVMKISMLSLRVTLCLQEDKPSTHQKGKMDLNCLSRWISEATGRGKDNISNCRSYWDP